MIQLYLMDCMIAMRKMDAESVATTIMDPPYGEDFMGLAWDHRPIVWEAGFWRALFPLMRPGGHVLAFGAADHYWRTITPAINAGFQHADTLFWCYKSGRPNGRKIGNWYSRLKPCVEPIAVFEKPVDGTYDRNINLHGVGGFQGVQCNLVHDGALDRFAYFPKVSNQEREAGCEDLPLQGDVGIYNFSVDNTLGGRGATSPRANDHKTVKPLALMQHLVEITTHPDGDGVVFDPFAGTGTTLRAAESLERDSIGCEKEGDHWAIIKAKLPEAKVITNTDWGDMFEEML